VPLAVVRDEVGVGADVGSELAEVLGELDLLLRRVLVLGVEVVFEPAEDLIGAEGVAVPQQPLELL
jgi:hypothetical protein